jgi:hypothetical protein
VCYSQASEEDDTYSDTLDAAGSAASPIKDGQGERWRVGSPNTSTTQLDTLLSVAGFAAEDVHTLPADLEHVVTAEYGRTSAADANAAVYALLQENAALRQRVAGFKRALQLGDSSNNSSSVYRASTSPGRGRHFTTPAPAAATAAAATNSTVFADSLCGGGSLTSALTRREVALSVKQHMVLSYPAVSAKLKTSEARAVRLAKANEHLRMQVNPTSFLCCEYTTAAAAAAALALFN